MTNSWPPRPEYSELGLDENLAEADEYRRQLKETRALYKKYGSYEAALNALARRDWLASKTNLRKIDKKLV